MWRFAASLLPILLLGAVGCDAPPLSSLERQSPAAPSAPSPSSLDDREALLLVLLVEHPTEATRRDAFRQLAAMGPRAAAAVPGLIGAFSSNDPRVRATAADVLGRIGEPAVPRLVALIENSSSPLELALACQTLGGIGAPAATGADAVIGCLGEADPGVRAAAALAVGRMHPPAASAGRTHQFTMQEGTTADFVRAIAGSTTNSPNVNASVRSVNPAPGQQRQLLEQFFPTHDIGPLGDEGKQKAVVTLSLGRVHEAPAKVVKALVTALSVDDDEVVRAAAAQGLGHLGSGAHQAVKPLIRALWDEAPVPENAAWALGQIGPRAAEAVPHLQQLLRRDSAARNAAHGAIVRIQE